MAIVDRKLNPFLCDVQKSKLELIVCRAVLSIMAKNPEMAFVKGGLFPKLGVAIPPPALELFVKRSESWESAHENAKILMEQG